MTHWYTPQLAVRTGIRVALSSIFGNFADRREAMALEAPVPDGPMDAAMDYGAVEGDFWLDYLSDTGDGYDATLAMARMLTEPGLAVQGLEEELPRGRVLVLGGDEVYPDPGQDAYRARLVAPFEAAAEEVTGVEQRAYGSAGPDLYALPGNHDWYDGLIAFGHLFCRRRVDIAGQATMPRPGRIIADWNTQQTRSYFALRLPGNWWLWAVDSQLSGYVDKSQVEYFAYAARHWMQPGARVILAVSSPSWRGAGQEDESAFETFDYICKIPEQAEDSEGKAMGHRVRLVLTGDHHHYTRYEEVGPEGPSLKENGPERPLTLIVAGGGGAFLHPTHHLAVVERHRLGRKAEERNQLPQRAFRIARQEAGSPEPGAEALWPPRDRSRALTGRNLGFAFLNPAMTATLFGVYLFYIWTLSLWSEALNGQSLLQRIDGLSFGAALKSYVLLIAQAPLHAMGILANLGIFYAFAGKARPLVRWLSAGGHWLAQALATLLAGWFTVWLLAQALPVPEGVTRGEALTVILGAIVAALVSSTVFGLYLMVQLAWLGRHWNEAFSALRIDRFRNFLKLRIGADGSLTVFPVGLETVPKAEEGRKALRPVLIEAPIRIEP